MKRFIFGISICAAIFMVGCAGKHITNNELASASMTNVAQLSSVHRDIAQSLEETLSAIAQSQDIPSISSGVIYQAGQKVDVNVGTLARNNATAVSQDSIFQIASLSKTLTAIIIQSLITEDALDPEGHIATYLTPLLTAEAVAEIDGITLTQLMQHRSGLTDNDCAVYRNRAEGAVVQSGYTRSELVADLNAVKVKDRETDAFRYTSCGYAVAGLVAEVVTNKDFDTLLRDYVTAPYDMPDTTLTLSEDQKSRLVTAYNKRNRSEAQLPHIMGKASPGSAIYSTVHDLQNLQAAQIKAYRAFENDGETSPLVLTEAITTANPRKTTGKPEFGSGLIVIPHPKGPFYVHDGDADGFASVYVFSPKDAAGIVILTGSGGSWVTENAVELLVDVIEKTESDRLQ